MRASVLHAVVGAGNVRYFLNAILSIRDQNAGDVFAAYNFMDSADRDDIEAARKQIEPLVDVFEVRENTSGQRTGSLYEANNAALMRARSAYRFISFVQADMQVVWWDSSIITRAEEILHSGLGVAGDIAFYTQLPVLGKHAEPYAHWGRDNVVAAYWGQGHSDVCLLPVYDGLNRDFVFQGSERDMMKQAVATGRRLYFHPFPYVAAIPFPKTVRDRSRYRGREDFMAESYPILRVWESFSPDFSSRELHPFSMESSIRPNGWACGFPYWPSDTESDLWVRRRLAYRRIFGGSLFAVVGPRVQPARSLFRSHRPGSKKLLIALARLGFESALRRGRVLGDILRTYRPRWLPRTR
jgi:hypothetical protein